MISLVSMSSGDGNEVSSSAEYLGGPCLSFELLPLLLD